MIRLNLYAQYIRDAILSGEKTIETRALNPEEPHRYFGDIQIGDTILLCNKITGEELPVKVINRRIRKNFDELRDNKDLLPRISNNKEILATINGGYDLKVRRDTLAPGYGDKCEYSGIIGFEIQFIS